MSSVKSYLEFFSIRSDQEYQETEEAETELELTEKEKAVPDSEHTYLGISDQRNSDRE